MFRLAFATMTALLIAGTAMSASQLYQQAELQLRRHAIAIQIPEDADPGQLEQIIQTLESAGADKIATENKIKAILRLE